MFSQTANQICLIELPVISPHEPRYCLDDRCAQAVGIAVLSFLDDLKHLKELLFGQHFIGRLNRADCTDRVFGNTTTASGDTETVFIKDFLDLEGSFIVCPNEGFPDLEGSQLFAPAAIRVPTDKQFRLFLGGIDVIVNKARNEILFPKFGVERGSRLLSVPRIVETVTLHHFDAIDKMVIEIRDDFVDLCVLGFALIVPIYGNEPRRNKLKAIWMLNNLFHLIILPFKFLMSEMTESK